MCYLTKLRIQITTHSLGGRVGIGHLRVLSLQILQFVHEEVELLIAYRGLVQDIISVVMLMQFLPQLFYARFLVHRL